MTAAAKHCLLVVDDEPDVCDSVHDLLRREFRVLKANGAQEGFRIMQEEEVHIIMTDQRMPRITGVELLEKVKSKNPLAVRMLFTGYADLESIIAAINQGHVYQFLRKPWQPEDLLSAVRQAAIEYERIIAQSEEADRLRSEIADLQHRVEALEGEVHRLRGSIAPHPDPDHHRRPTRGPEPVVAVEPSISPTQHPPTRHTLLIVDDEPDVLDSLRHLFHRTYRVVTAESGEQALEALGRQEVHVILSDQRMPGMTGDALLGFARRLYPDAIRMLFTGYADLEAVIKAVNEGHIFRYIVKPWDPEELQSVIRQAVEQYDLLAERKRLIGELRSANARLVRAQREPLRGQPVEERPSSRSPATSSTRRSRLILGLSEPATMLKDPGRDEGDRQIIDQIIRAGRQLAKLVADMLILMQSNDFGRTIHRSEVDLALLLHEAADRLMPFVESRRLRFDVDVSADLGSFEIDAPKVRDAVLNLLTNALEIHPRRRRDRPCRPACFRTPDEAEIVISDRGIGMEPRAVRRLFEPFFTEFDPSRHSSGDFGFEKRGLGLGLCIAKQFVELHGGRISAESEPGRGTRVTIHLPRRPFPGASREVELNVPDGGTAPG